MLYTDVLPAVGSLLHKIKNFMVLVRSFKGMLASNLRGVEASLAVPLRGDPLDDLPGLEGVGQRVLRHQGQDGIARRFHLQGVAAACCGDCVLSRVQGMDFVSVTISFPRLLSNKISSFVTF